MRLGDVLNQIEGLNKRFVYYLEAQGYIHPSKIPKARISRRDYSSDDLRLIQEIWIYYRRGYSVQNAHEMATRGDRSVAFALVPVPARKWGRMLEILRRQDRVQEAAVVYGESADVIARIAVPEESEVYAVLNEAFDLATVAGVPSILKVVPAFARLPVQGPTNSLTASPSVGDGSPELPGSTAMRAYVLIKVPAKQTGGVVQQLQDFAGVVEASVIYGETDIIAKVEVAHQDELDELIVDRIQGLPAVESTRTFIVVGRMFWQR